MSLLPQIALFITKEHNQYYFYPEKQGSVFNHYKRVRGFTSIVAAEIAAELMGYRLEYQDDGKPQDGQYWNDGHGGPVNLNKEQEKKHGQGTSNRS